MARAAKKDYQKEYLQIIRKLDGDEAGRAAATQYLIEAYPHGNVDFSRWATNPVIFDSSELAILEDAATTFGSIMEKVMAKYHRDRSFRKLFALSPRVEELTLVPSGCHAAVPLARVDLFFNRKTKDFKICGVATGGVSGMAAATEIDRAVHLTNAFHVFSEQHPKIVSFDPVTACVEQLLHTYSTWANAEVGRNHPTKPALAILDVKDSPRALETKRFIDCLLNMGYYARPTTFDQLHIKRVGNTEQLVDDNGPITCVWLRATADEAAQQDENCVRALTRATSHGLVCTIGGYRSWPCCTRSFMEVLRSKDCQILLSSAENAFIDKHVPVTHIIQAATDLSEFYDQENWTLKISDGRWADGVVAGANLSKGAWRTRLVKSIKRHDAVQTYLEQQPMTVAYEGEHEMNVILGVYVFGGKFSGVRACCGTGATISDWKDRLEMDFITVVE